MNEDFPRTLALLRQERKVSQRQAAAALGISQALLSHYENGVREPGLNFVVRACDYYNVSADFLLGRTLSRDGTTILDADSLYDISGERDNVLRGSVMATLSRKLLVNSAGVLFDLLGKLGSKDAIRAASNFLATSVYIMYRHLHSMVPGNREGFFAVPPQYFMAGLPRVDLILSEVDYVDALNEAQKEGAEFPAMDHDDMAAAYPGTYQSLLQIIHSCGERFNAQMDHHRASEKK